NHLKNVSATNGPARDHRHNGFRAASHLDMQVRDMEPPSRTCVGLIAAIPTNSLVTTGTERLSPLPCQNDNTDRFILASNNQRFGYLNQCLRSKRIMHLGASDGDLCDAVVSGFIANVFEIMVLCPDFCRGALSHRCSLSCKYSVYYIGNAR